MSHKKFKSLDSKEKVKHLFDINPHRTNPSIDLLFSSYRKPEASYSRTTPLTESRNLDFGYSDNNVQPASPSYLNMKFINSERSQTFRERTIVNFKIASTYRVIESIKGSDRVYLLSQQSPKPQGSPVCLKGVIIGEERTNKLKKEIKNLREELNNINLNLKTLYELGLINDNVYELCCDPELNLVRDDESARHKIYHDSNLQLATNKIVRKVIKYHGLKRQLKYTLEKPHEFNNHTEHYTHDKLRKKPAFPVEFKKQLTRPPLKIEPCYSHRKTLSNIPKSVQGLQKSDLKKSFQFDELRNTHAFDSYINREFILGRVKRFSGPSLAKDGLNL